MKKIKPKKVDDGKKFKVSVSNKLRRILGAVALPSNYGVDRELQSYFKKASERLVIQLFVFLKHLLENSRLDPGCLTSIIS